MKGEGGALGGSAAWVLSVDVSVTTRGGRWPLVGLKDMGLSWSMAAWFF